VTSTPTSVVNQLSVISPDWPVPARVRSAFTLRMGGVSVAPYDSLNVGAHVGDAAEAVQENRQRVREKLRLPGEPAWLQQVHGAEVADAAVADERRGTCAPFRLRTACRCCLRRGMPPPLVPRTRVGVG
jgi:polyphenol oxidase